MNENGDADIRSVSEAELIPGYEINTAIGQAGGAPYLQLVFLDEFDEALFSGWITPNMARHLIEALQRQVTQAEGEAALYQLLVDDAGMEPLHALRVISRKRQEIAERQEQEEERAAEIAEDFIDWLRGANESE